MKKYFLNKKQKGKKISFLFLIFLSLFLISFVYSHEEIIPPTDGKLPGPPKIRPSKGVILVRDCESLDRNINQYDFGDRIYMKIFGFEENILHKWNITKNYQLITNGTYFVDKYYRSFSESPCIDSGYNVDDYGSFILTFNETSTYYYVADNSGGCPLDMSGNGTISNPCRVENWKHLSSIRGNLGASYLLVENLSSLSSDYEGIGDNWNPLGKVNNLINEPFKGIFDGNKNHIKDLTISMPEENYLGLFSSLESYAEIKNLELEANIEGNIYLGGFAGLNRGSIYDSKIKITLLGKGYMGGVAGINRGIISGVYSSGSIRGDYFIGGIVGHSLEGEILDSNNYASIEGGYYQGGIAGMLQNSIVSNSHNEGATKGELQRNGGIAGFSRDSIISDSTNKGDIYGHRDIGGIAGRLSNSTIINCSNEGAIQGFFDVLTSVGGIVGMSGDSWIENCKNLGSISGTTEGSVVGGIAGWNYRSSILNSLNQGPILGKTIVGGISGLNDGSISKSYNRGNVSARKGVGGVSGVNYRLILNSYNEGDVFKRNGPEISGFLSEESFAGFSGYNSGTINNSYSIGRVKSEIPENPTNKGFIGEQYPGEDTLFPWGDYGNFFDIQKSGQTSTTGNAWGKSSLGMKEIDSFLEKGWDISYSSENINEGYPFLSWEIGKNTPVWSLWQDRANFVSCFDYSEDNSCGEDEFRLAKSHVEQIVNQEGYCDGLGVSCFCYWDQEKCNPGYEIEGKGICSYISEIENDCLNSENLIYNLRANWTSSEGLLPDESCEDIQNLQLPCIRQVYLDYFNIFNFLFAIITLTIFYYFSYSKEKCKII
jgi:uncharacterized protein YidB (DUF937 family)